MANPMYGQNKMDNSLDKLVGSPMVELAESKTLTAEDSGKVFSVGTGSAAAYTLPAATEENAGVRFMWVWTAAETDAITIVTADITDTTGDMLYGGLLNCSAAAVNTLAQAGSNHNTITLDDNLANSGGGEGTWVEIVCLGKSKWFVRGVVEADSDADGTGSAIFSNAD
jgi:hypothetical protein